MEIGDTPPLRDYHDTTMFLSMKLVYYIATPVGKLRGPNILKISHIECSGMINRYLENQLLSISINFTPETSHSRLKKAALSYVFDGIP